jgi:hypothetical protein
MIVCALIFELPTPAPWFGAQGLSSFPAQPQASSGNERIRSTERINGKSETWCKIMSRGRIWRSILGGFGVAVLNRMLAVELPPLNGA